MRTALLGLASRLRFPWLLVVTALLFLASVVFPDPVPFLDELLLGMLTLLFAAWRKRRDDGAGEKESQSVGGTHPD
jgi:hypothetical protein